MAEHRFLKFPQAHGSPARSFPPGWQVVEGDPLTTTSRHYTSDDGTVLAGHWQCTPGAFAVEYSSFEFCHMLAGRCVITPDGASPVSLSAGDAFAIEPGFRGRWEVLETMRKHFVFKIDKR